MARAVWQCDHKDAWQRDWSAACGASYPERARKAFGQPLLAELAANSVARVQSFGLDLAALRAQATAFYGDGFAFCPVPARTYPDTHRMMWTQGDWTDDTDQLVLVLQSLLHSRGVGRARSGAPRGRRCLPRCGSIPAAKSRPSN